VPALFCAVRMSICGTATVFFVAPLYRQADVKFEAEGN
jgi:hypothetical protein